MWSGYFGDCICGNTDYVLEQFTGLHDKNGREIYEGDICRFNVAEGRNFHEPAMKNQVGVVGFGFGAFTFGEWAGEWMTDKVVIGNIRENPELVKP